MSDKQYRDHMEAITMNQKAFIGQYKDYHRQAYGEWLCLMGLFETWDLII